MRDEGVLRHAALTNPCRQPGEAIGYAHARVLRRYLEHMGDVNGSEYLRAMRDAGVEFSEDRPLVLGVYDGTRASVAEGNHRLLLSRRDKLVPYVVREGDDPGVSLEYDGSLGTPGKPKMLGVPRRRS